MRIGTHAAVNVTCEKCFLCDLSMSTARTMAWTVVQNVHYSGVN